MAETLYLKELRNTVDNKYVGFKPNGGSVKPVHIYSGASRSIYESSADTSGIRKLSFVSDKKGNTPEGNDLDSVFAFLSERGIISADIKKDALKRFRDISQKLLSTDKAYYSGDNDSINSYTAASRNFVSIRAMYEDAGEFVGDIIKQYCPILSNQIKNDLNDINDPTSILFNPITKRTTEFKSFTDNSVKDLKIVEESNNAWKSFCLYVKESGECLSEHLKKHNNKYTKFRLFNCFCIYILFRYLASLEYLYCDIPCRPFVFDFSGQASSSIAKLSVLSYTQIHQSISRFYAWAFAQELDLLGFSKKDLMNMDAPTIDKNAKSKSGDDRIIPWENAKVECKNIKDENEVRLVFGGAIYDILAVEASSHPIVYLRQISTSIGLLFPPTNMHSKKRFVVSQDMLEMIMRCCVSPNETLTAEELRDRLWKRMGIIIGGGQYDLQILQSQGSIIQADSDALRLNFEHFSNKLESMNFATIMADGILQINLGGFNNED